MANCSAPRHEGGRRRGRGSRAANRSAGDKQPKAVAEDFPQGLLIYDLIGPGGKAPHCEQAEQKINNPSSGDLPKCTANPATAFLEALMGEPIFSCTTDASTSDDELPTESRLRRILSWASKSNRSTSSNGCSVAASAESSPALQPAPACAELEKTLTEPLLKIDPSPSPTEVGAERTWTDPHAKFEQQSNLLQPVTMLPWQTPPSALVKEMAATSAGGHNVVIVPPATRASQANTDHQQQTPQHPFATAASASRRDVSSRVPPSLAHAVDCAFMPGAPTSFAPQIPEYNARAQRHTQSQLHAPNSGFPVGMRHVHNFQMNPGLAHIPHPHIHLQPHVGYPPQHHIHHALTAPHIRIAGGGPLHHQGHQSYASQQPLAEFGFNDEVITVGGAPPMRTTRNDKTWQAQAQAQAQAPAMQVRGFNLAIGNNPNLNPNAEPFVPPIGAWM